MKKLLLLLFGTCPACCGVATARTCANSPAGSAAGCTVVVADPAGFLANSFQDGLGEIQLSQPALQNSQDRSLRAFAQLMIDDRGAANKAIALLAQRKAISLPDDLPDGQRAQTAQLSNASGACFEKLYAGFNITLHEKAAAAFRDQSVQASDTEIRGFAGNNLPIEEVHPTLARLLDERLDPSAYLMHAYQEGQAEVHISELALDRTANAGVKSFAPRMVDDHTGAAVQIQALARQKSASLPDKLMSIQQAALGKLLQMSRPDCSARCGTPFSKCSLPTSRY